MISPSMVSIAACRGVDIFAPASGKFAFLKSPFAAHSTLSAVDIYPGSDFGDIAPSPVEGTVMDIREYPTPTPYKDRDFVEYLIAIRQADSVIKILHVKPLVEVGDMLAVGDPLGTLIHNGYFYFWNDPPMHVEVRQTGDYIRASNHNPLMSRFGFSTIDTSMESEIHCQVVFCDKRYALLEGEYEGQVVRGYRLGGCLLDGLVPVGPVDAIDYFGLIGECAPGPSIGSVGNRYMMPADSVRAEILADSPVGCLALGFSLSCSVPTIKVIPIKYGQKLFNVGDDVTIRLSLFWDSEVK